VQRLRRLSTDRRVRRSERAFVIEGPLALQEALDAAVDLESVFADAGADTTLLDRAAAAGATVVPVADGVLARTTDAVTPQGVAAVVRRPDHALARVAPDVPVLVLVAIADPGNAGTLLRTAEAAGFGAVVFCAASVDPWAPKVVRASAGSALRVPVIEAGEAEGVLQEMGAAGRQRVGTRPLDAPLYTDADLAQGAAVVLGSEAHGLPAALDDHLDAWVRIPMAGEVESLNVAMAGTLLCFEVARRTGSWPRS